MTPRLASVRAIGRKVVSPQRASVILPDRFDESEIRKLFAALGKQAIGFKVASSR